MNFEFAVRLLGAQSHGFSRYFMARAGVSGAAYVTERFRRLTRPNVFGPTLPSAEPYESANLQRTCGRRVAAFASKPKCPSLTVPYPMPRMHYGRA